MTKSGNTMFQRNYFLIVYKIKFNFISCSSQSRASHSLVSFLSPCHSLPLSASKASSSSAHSLETPYITIIWVFPKNTFLKSPGCFRQREIASRLFSSHLHGQRNSPCKTAQWVFLRAIDSSFTHTKHTF